jgi:hypothetical protein
MHYYRNPRAYVSWMAVELHKSGAAGAHRVRCSPRRECAALDLCRRRFRGSRDRADHLERLFAALHVYLTAIIADTSQNIPGRALDRRYLENLFRDLSGDALVVIRNAAEEMREHENWRAS